MFIKNFKTLVKLTGKTQKLVCSEMHVTESAIWQWEHKTNPTGNTLRRIAHYFTLELDLPPDLLGDGKILLTEDVEKVIAARNLPDPRKQQVHQEPQPYQATEIPPLSTITDHELRFLSSVRRLIHGRPDIPVGEISLNQILELETLAGPGSENHRSLIRMIQGLRYAGNQIRKKADPPNSEVDKK